MGAKTTSLATDVLNHILNNVPISNIGDGAGLPPSATVGDLYLSLHTADPGVGGNQTTNETTYTGYQRIPVARDGTQWAVAVGSAANIAELLFPLCTLGSATITFVGIGSSFALAGDLLYRAAVITPVAGLLVSPGITPKIVSGAAVVTES